MKKKPARRLWRVIKTVLLFLLMLPVCAGAFGCSYLLGLPEWKNFDPSVLETMSEASVLCDAQGSVFRTLPAAERRVCIDIKTLPDHVKYAFIAVEDARFYQHSGVDVIRIGGALIADIRSGSLKEGASTISQQLIKNRLLTSEKKLERKLNEAVMALKLERYYEKDEILEMYLNYNYFGAGAYGIEMAARTYFNKSARDLSIAEAATIAGILKAPGRYAPHLDAEKSRERRDLIIDLMAEEGFITEARARTEKKKPLVLDMREEEDFGFFTDMAIDECCTILNCTRAELYSGGYVVQTTLCPEVQRAAQASFAEDALFPENASDGVPCEAAFCAIDNATGGICAVVGAREYVTAFGLNRATQSYRQPGSAIKPILVYAPALERLDFSPVTFLLDEPCDFSGYSPKNFSGRTQGWVTLRDAVAKSLNIPAVKVFHMLGVDRGKEYASSVGIPFAEEDDSLTLALGGFTTGVTPLSLAAAYTPFASGGRYTSPYCVSEITTREGETVYRREEGRVYVLSPENAYIMTSMLTSAVEYGTAKRLAIEGVEIAAKTGTSSTENASGSSDGWIVGYTPDYTCCVWMGFDYTDEKHCLPADITGGTKPALLLRSVFTQVYAEKTPRSFIPPSGVQRIRIDAELLTRSRLAVPATVFTTDWRYEYFTSQNAPR